MKVARYFDRNAAAFDALYEDDNRIATWLNHLFRRGLYQRVHLTVQELNQLESPSILDIGCGSGRNSVVFVKAGARRVVGIDFAEEMLRIARARVSQHKLQDQCEFRKEDFLTLPPGEQYDASVALGVFDYVDEPVPFLRKMLSHTRARVILSLPGISLIRAPQRKIRYALRGCPVYFYSRRRIDSMCREAGLTRYRLLPCGSSGYLLVGQLD